MRITLAQVDVHLGDIDANVELAAEVIEEATKASSELIVFPELHLSGYSIGAVDADLSMRPDDPRIVKLARHAGPAGLLVGFVTLPLHRASSRGAATSRLLPPAAG